MCVYVFVTAHFTLFIRASDLTLTFIMAHHFITDYYNMIRLYFLNGESAARAAVEYARVYPNARHPDANVINGAVRRLREMGNVIAQVQLLVAYKE